ncbi:hypothetical protein BTM25_36910 [Actinomadura rubteroloni]|uniref:Uncharacterized protein n=1 Tax=Actinomadura rubteroloni TaxID=1926885 RepID=A0A2P4UJ05_9ACTN|nr:hypothetical protein [Actinomadura rubteroloni]POM25049.1 hypothetical protein BTM25_36910 [Actinomadura rubteroloni]
MRVVLALAAALGTVVAGLVLDAALVLLAGAHVTTWPSSVATVLLVHVPWTVALGLAVVVADAVHRGRGPAHAVALFGVPALAAALSVVAGAGSHALAGGLVAAVEAAAGAALAALAVRRLRPSDAGYLPAR